MSKRLATRRARLDSSRLDPIYAHRKLALIAARWDQRAAIWERELADPASPLNADKGYARFLIELQQLIGERRSFYASRGAIEVGCGTGTVLAQIISGFAWGIGIDLSPRMIGRAKRKRIDGVRFTVGDGFELPRLCPQAGLVLSRGVLLSHYGPRQAEELLRSARAALCPGGVAVFDFLNAAGRCHSRHAAENKYWFTAAQARALARRAGFSRIHLLGKACRRVRLLAAQ